MRYFIELSYRGTLYNGWQRQKNAPSIQQIIEESLSKILRAQTEIVGAGRTDTGVHATYYVAHFDTNQDIDSTDDFCHHLNAVLPESIAIQAVIKVAEGAHARFDAVEREYKYYILPHKDPFCRDTTWQYYVDLDLESMNRAARMLLEYSDFTTFSKLHSANKTNICKITDAHLSATDDNRLIFTIRADRFLRNMVRSIVATLVDVGRKKISEDEFRLIVESRDLSRARGSAPAQGLFLTDIKYPENILKHK